MKKCVIFLAFFRAFLLPDALFFLRPFSGDAILFETKMIRGIVMEFFIRPVEAKDAAAFSELRRMPGVFENILGIPSERTGQNEDFLNSLGPNNHQFVAIAREDDGAETLIGSIGLTVFSQPRRRHCGHIVIMVHRDYQGIGAGTALMQAAVNLADRWLMLHRLELSVFADNTRAIALYEKFGFEKEGYLHGSAIRDGQYADEWIMGRIHP